MQIVYRYEAYPSREQEEKLFYTLKLCRKLYNHALNERQVTYKETGRGLTYNQQQNKLPAFVKANPEYSHVHSQVLQDVLRRLDSAYQRFFAKEAGYPRFKNRDHYTSLTYPQVDNVKKTFSRSGSVYLSKIGFMKIETHREFPVEAITRINVKYHGGKWFANLTAEIPNVAPIGNPGKAVGIDVGLNHFAVLSDEKYIDNPKYYRKMEKKLAKAQRRLSRKKKGSHNRGKAKTKVAKLHAKIANQRKDFLHQASVRVVRNYDLMVMEDLKVHNMVRNHRLAKSIHDAGWGQFKNYIRYKCEHQGKQFILVDPKGTSQTCLCGESVRKDLSVRVHECPICGLVMDRDLVSFKLILARGLSTIA